MSALSTNSGLEGTTYRELGACFHQRGAARGQKCRLNPKSLHPFSTAWINLKSRSAWDSPHVCSCLCVIIIDLPSYLQHFFITPYSWYWRSCYIEIVPVFFNQGEPSFRAALQTNSQSSGGVEFYSAGRWHLWLSQHARTILTWVRLHGATISWCSFYSSEPPLFTVWHLTHLKRKKYQVSLRLWTRNSPTLWQNPLPRELT